MTLSRHNITWTTSNGKPDIARGCQLAGVPLFGGWWVKGTSPAGNDWTLTGYGLMPVEFGVLPVLRFDIAAPGWKWAGIPDGGLPELRTTCANEGIPLEGLATAKDNA